MKSSCLLGCGWIGFLSPICYLRHFISLVWESPPKWCSFPNLIWVYSAFLFLKCELIYMTGTILAELSSPRRLRFMQIPLLTSVAMVVIMNLPTLNRHALVGSLAGLLTQQGSLLRMHLPSQHRVPSSGSFFIWVPRQVQKVDSPSWISIWARPKTPERPPVFLECDLLWQLISLRRMKLSISRGRA